MAFKADLKRFTTRVVRGSDKMVRKVGVAGYQQVATRTPVDNGFAKANWMPAVNSVDQSKDSNNSNFDVGKADGVFTQAKVGDDLNISNSMPYIKKLEYGYSLQAPSGMVTLTVKDLKKRIEQGEFND